MVIGQLRKPQHSRPTPSLQTGKDTFRWIGHSPGTLKVILIDVARNPERGVVVMYNNVDLITEIYEGINMEKL